MSANKISRRTFLYAGGAVIALPFLEAMLPFGRMAYAAGERPRRFAIVFFPHGTTQASDWNPTVTSSGLKMNASGMLDALSPYSSDLSFYSNFMADSWALHPGGVATTTCGGHADKEYTVKTIKTIDQLIADQIQVSGRIRNINMGSNEQSGGEASVSGVYGTNISWISSTTPATRYMSNSQIFNLIVPGGASTTTPPPAAGVIDKRKSVLDFAKDSIARAQAQLGATDKQTLDQYLTGLREVEKKIQVNPDVPASADPTLNNTTLNPAMAVCSKSGTAEGACSDYPTDMDIKMDLMALAFQADRTRVMTHMFDPEPGYRNMSFISGVTGQSHPNSHWRDNPTKLGPMVQKTTAFYASKFARLLGRLKSMNEVGGTVLDNSLIIYLSSMMDAHNHEGTNLPMILAGRNSGTFNPGQFKQMPSRTNVSALYLTIAKSYGINLSSYNGMSGTVNL